MSTTPLRLIAALLLGGQLLSLGLPLLCKSVHPVAIAGCEQSMGPRSKGPAVAAATDQAVCANPAFCAVTPTAIAGDLAVALAPSAVHRAALPVAPPINPGDPPAPLSPPPQA